MPKHAAGKMSWLDQRSVSRHAVDHVLEAVIELLAVDPAQHLLAEVVWALTVQAVCAVPALKEVVVWRQLIGQLDQGFHHQEHALGYSKQVLIAASQFAAVGLLDISAQELQTGQEAETGLAAALIAAAFAVAAATAADRSCLSSQRTVCWRGTVQKVWAEGAAEDSGSGFEEGFALELRCWVAELIACERANPGQCQPWLVVVQLQPHTVVNFVVCKSNVIFVNGVPLLNPDFVRPCASLSRNKLLQIPNCVVLTAQQTALQDKRSLERKA